MALPAWPEGLNYKPLVSSFRVLEATRPPVWTEFEDGPPLARRSGLANRARLAYAIHFKTWAEFNTFRQFHKVTLADGSSRFTMPVHSPGVGCYPVRTVMIDNGVISAEPAGRGFIVSFTLIVFDW
ncbi:hypothetical protein ACFOYU_11265 [Microvirga sp. GCM10011540]|uniref:hypothetical protein n=1 Tax=Microvirga sp. GCM10011540 TaxID=3317338 RepID=UPI003607461D